MLPFDINVMRRNNDNDPEIERALLTLFIQSVGKSIEEAHALWPELITTAAGLEEWKHHLHRIRSAAVNLGATELVNQARFAQEHIEDSADFEKQDYLLRIEDAFNEVADYIDTLIKA